MRVAFKLLGVVGVMWLVFSIYDWVTRPWQTWVMHDMMAWENRLRDGGFWGRDCWGGVSDKSHSPKLCQTGDWSMRIELSPRDVRLTSRCHNSQLAFEREMSLDERDAFLLKKLPAFGLHRFRVFWPPILCHIRELDAGSD